MPEGLDPVEAGRKTYEHTHEQEDEQQTSQRVESEASKRHERHSRILQTGEAILLALVTIAAAWAGYAAARWGTTSRVEIAQSSTLRNLATRADLEALTTRNFDSSTFNAWFIAFSLGNKKDQLIAERRFRPAFRVAFNAWMATHPLTNPNAPPGPTYMPQYKLPQQAKANALDAAATAKFNEGTHGGEVSDNYIRITVFLAAVLFLVGIGSTFKLHQIRYALIAFGTALLVLATVLIFHEPGLPH
jgi:hypothetical protein